MSNNTTNSSAQAELLERDRRASTKRRAHNGEESDSDQINIPIKKARTTTANNLSDAQAQAAIQSANPEEELDSVKYKIQRHIFKEQIMAFYFRNMEFTDGDVRMIVDKSVSCKSHAFGNALADGRMWQGQLQKAVWNSKYFREHASLRRASSYACLTSSQIAKHVAEFNKLDPTGNTTYEAMSGEAKSLFWQQNPRFNEAVARKMLHPLSRGIDVESIINDNNWMAYFSAVFARTCQDTWNLDLKLERAADVKQINNNRKVIYDRIRECPERVAPGRPPVSMVPLPVGGIVARKPRRVGQRRNNLEVYPFAFDPNFDPEEMVDGDGFDT